MRTILVWLGGDNNLSDETGRKIEALRQGWTYTGNKCLIYQDSRDGARLLRLRGGCRTTPPPYVEIVREYGAENSASPATFARVLREVADEYPADSYGLIFFSHASGWLPAGTLQNPQKQRKRSRSIGVDDGGTGRAEMEIAEFAAAIPDGMFDFIVFETCLTAGVEVAYELRGKSDYMLASAAEIVSPGFTPVYPSALRLLCNTAVETRAALEAFGHAWMNYVATNYTGARRSAMKHPHWLPGHRPRFGLAQPKRPTYPVFSILIVRAAMGILRPCRVSSIWMSGWRRWPTRMNTRRSGPSWNGRWCGKPRRRHSWRGRTDLRSAAIRVSRPMSNRTHFPTSTKPTAGCRGAGPCMDIDNKTANRPCPEKPIPKEKAAAENRGLRFGLVWGPYSGCRSSAC